MSEMIERVARALHALPSERWSEVPWGELQTQERDRLLREARAAINAMRELPDELYEAYSNAADPSDGPAACHLQTEAYKAMIDAALGINPPPD